MTKRTIVPIGPYHALQEEPEFFKLHVEGETVVHLDIELGYNHRGVEKLSESKDFEETIFLVERICGICSTSHPLACVQAIEEAGGITVPERALFIRTIVGELERIHSHLLWLGLAGHFIGFNTIWMWAWRFREDVLNILELISGNRNHYGMMKPGGVRRDILDTDIPAINKLLDGLQDPIKMFRDAVVEDPLLRARTQGIGILSREKAIAYGALGPTARASGVAIDVRRDHPHAAYGMVDWDVVTCKHGDVFDKAVVRILEMFESIRIIEQCLVSLGTVKGPVDSDPKCVAPGEGIGHYEAPRGEVFHYIRSDGGNRPVRHKVRAPSFMNVPTNCETVLGETVADATIILAAVDPCYCCTERMAVAVDSEGGQRLWDARELIRLSCEKTDRLADETGWSGPQPPGDMSPARRPPTKAGPAGDMSPARRPPTKAGPAGDMSPARRPPTKAGHAVGTGVALGPGAAVGAGHAREQKGAGIGAALVPEHKVARMAASYKAMQVARMAASYKAMQVARMAASYKAMQVARMAASSTDDT